MTYINDHQWACINLAKNRGYFDTQKPSVVWVWVMTAHGERRKIKSNNVMKFMRKGWSVVAPPLCNNNRNK